MTDDPQPHHRRSLRLKDYDYTQAGAYFLTICAQDRLCVFGDVMDGAMRLSDAGRIVERCWLDIPRHSPHVALDVFVVMPNHVHGIIVIADGVGARHAVPLRSVERFGYILNNAARWAYDRENPQVVTPELEAACLA